MRASRLLRILLILQNRGRRTAGQLAVELECAPRTILRDVDAMTEAGLPIIVHQGNQGGIELGFNYRTRLTGLTDGEARAMAVQLATPSPAVQALGMIDEFHIARAKLAESLPDRSRLAHEAMAATITARSAPVAPDPYVIALAEAIRDRQIVTLRARSAAPQACHPARLEFDGTAWLLFDARAPAVPIPQADWGDLNISSRTFPPGP